MLQFIHSLRESCLFWNRIVNGYYLRAGLFRTVFFVNYPELGVAFVLSLVVRDNSSL